MIQRPATGAFDLELGHLANSGEKSFALATSAIFQHLHGLFFQAASRALSGEILTGSQEDLVI